MINLLSANFLRLRKSVLFWIALLLSAAFGAWMPLQTSMEFGQLVSLDSVCFTYTILIGLLLAVFLPLLFGSEYSDGAIRNKLTMGHTRLSVYLANLTTAVLTALIFCAAYILFMLAVGLPLLGGLKMPPRFLLVTLLCSLLMSAAYCAVFTFITMNLSRKAGAAVGCILLFLALFTGALAVYQMLEAEEYYPYYELVDGEMVYNMARNPEYLQGNKRKAYEFLLDLNPVGQAVQYTDLTTARPLQLALCSLGVIAVTTAAGTALFQRKDLK